MKAIGKDELVAVLRLRFDYYSAQSVFELAIGDAGLEDRASYDVDQVVAFSRSLTRVSDHVEPIVQQLQSMLPDGVVLVEQPEPEPVAPAPEPVAPAAEAPPAPEPAAPETANAVTFLLRGAATTPDQEVMVCGGLPEIGDWKPEGAAALKAESKDVHSVSLPLPAKSSFEFKFLRRTKDGKLEWEGGDNRSFTVPETGAGRIEAEWR